MKKIISIIIMLLLWGLVLWSCSDEDNPTVEENAAPICNIVSPLDSSEFDIGDSILVEVNATDEDGSISEVRFYFEDDGYIDSTPPYEYTIETIGYLEGFYDVNVVAEDNEGKETSTSISFQLSIPDSNTITIVTPNGGEMIERESEYQISWYCSNDIVNKTVNLELYRNDIKDTTLAVNIDNTGSRLWSVPLSLTSGQPYKIKISLFDNSSIFDFSDNEFYVKGDIDVITPNGTQCITMGNPYTIKWDDNLTEPVKVELYKNDSLNYTILDSAKIENSRVSEILCKWHFPSFDITCHPLRKHNV